jgi:hypothetical protein
LWFEDLSPCTYFPVDVKLVSVGWLERGKPYTTGEVDRAVYDALVEMVKNPWQGLACGGFHECDLCQFAGEARGCANLFVPADGVLYVAPQLITHYINAHGYVPPAIFSRAVLACPPMRSMAYLKAVRDAGGAALARTYANDSQT